MQTALLLFTVSLLLISFAVLQYKRSVRADKAAAIELAKKQFLSTKCGKATPTIDSVYSGNDTIYFYAHKKLVGSSVLQHGD